MKRTLTVALAALALSTTAATAGPMRPPPIKCHPPKVARMVTIVVHQYQRRHEWRCVRP